MLVRLQRTGGIAGLRVRAEVDSEQLAPAQKREMKKLVEAGLILEKIEQEL